MVDVIVAAADLVLRVDTTHYCKCFFCAGCPWIFSNGFHAYLTYSVRLVGGRLGGGGGGLE